MRVAIQGCAHGQLDMIYEELARKEDADGGRKVYLLLCCGDFESIRNLADLKAKVCPEKYKKMGTFWQYYSGVKTAPVLTIFIGGNHEATNYLQELPFGGWVAPNIYYMGYAGVVCVQGRTPGRGLRIGGLSGIYKKYNYRKGHYERPPYDRNSERSAYHIRNVDTFRLRQLKACPPVIMMSHDWPVEVWRHGDYKALGRERPHWAQEMEEGTLGSGPTQEVLDEVRPAHWFSAHLHAHFTAEVRHDPEEFNREKLYKKPLHPTTKFLALGKADPQFPDNDLRPFLDVMSIEEEELDGIGKSEPLSVHLDPAWLAIVRSTGHLYKSRNDVQKNYMPDPTRPSKGREDFSPTEEEVAAVRDLFGGDLRASPERFSTALVRSFDPERDDICMLRGTKAPSEAVLNQQTVWICNTLGVRDPMEEVLAAEGRSFYTGEEDTERQMDKKKPKAGNGSKYIVPNRRRELRIQR